MSRLLESLSSFADGVWRRLFPYQPSGRQSASRPATPKAAPKTRSRRRWVKQLGRLLTLTFKWRKRKVPFWRLWLKKTLRQLKSRLRRFKLSLSRRIYWLIVFAALALLCGAVIGGYKIWHQRQIRKQTLVTVNSEPITQADLAAEVMTTGVDYKQLDAKARRLLLDRIVERRLLIDVGQKQAITTDARSTALRANADETFLAKLVMQRFAGAPPPPPSDDDARRYMAAHPALFADRQTFVIDGIICVPVAMPARSDVRFDTLDAAENFLRDTKVPYRRQFQNIDSASLPPGAAAALAALRPDKVFVMPQGRAILIGTVHQHIAASTPPEIQLEAAREALSKLQIETRLTKAIAELRAKAVIRYTDQ